MKKISLISDVLFISFCVFLLSFVIINYFTTRLISFVISITISLIFGILLTKIYFTKYKKKNNKTKEDKNYKEVCCELNFMPAIELKNLVYKALSENGNTIIKRKKYLCDKQEKTVILLKFRFEKVDKADILSLFNNLNVNEKGIIISNEFAEEIKEFAAKFNNKIELQDSHYLYEILKNTNNLPKILYTSYYHDEKQKTSIKNIINKKHAKRFFFLGVYFMIFSFFVSLKLYYVIAGSIFIIFAIIIKIFGKQENLA